MIPATVFVFVILCAPRVAASKERFVLLYLPPIQKNIDFFTKI